MNQRYHALCCFFIYALFALSSSARADGILCAHQDIIGSYQLNRTFGIAQRDGLVYTVGRDDGLVITDITDPAMPVQIGDLIIEDSRTIELHETYAYIGSLGGDELFVIDISDPTNPLQLQTLLGMNDIESMTVSNGVLLVVDRDESGKDELNFFGLQDPENPVLLSKFDPIGIVNSMDAHGTHAYLSSSSNVEVNIVDFSDPAKPSLLATIPFDDPPRAVASDGDSLVVLGVQGGIGVYLVSDPTKPALIGSLELYQGITGKTILDGDRVFIGTNTGNFEVLDLSIPESPTHLGRYEFDIGIIDFVSSDNTIFAAVNRYPQGKRAWILDTTTPPTSPLLWFIQQKDGPVHTIETSGTELFYFEGADLEIYDISNPGTPDLLSTTRIHHAHDFLYENQLLYIASNDEGIRVLDVSDPLLPVETSTLQLAGSVTDIVKDELWIYAIGEEINQGRFYIVNSVNPPNMGLLTSLSLPFVPSIIFQDGDYVYIADGIDFLIVDIGLIWFPRIVGTGQLSKSINSMTAQNGYLYLGLDANYSFQPGEFRVVDVTDPSMPIETAGLDLGDQVNHIQIGEDGYIYTVGSGSGLNIIDIQTPDDPVLLADYTLFFWAYDMAIHNSIGYVADGTFGILALDLGADCNTCFADYDNNEILNLQDIFAFLADFNLGLPQADVNGDSFINLADFFAYLDAFNTGCQ